jgi:hypothetical protein
VYISNYRQKKAQRKKYDLILDPIMPRWVSLLQNKTNFWFDSMKSTRLTKQIRPSQLFTLHPTATNRVVHTFAAKIFVHARVRWQKLSQLQAQQQMRVSPAARRERRKFCCGRGVWFAAADVVYDFATPLDSGGRPENCVVAWDRRARMKLWSTAFVCERIGQKRHALHALLLHMRNWNFSN